MEYTIAVQYHLQHNHYPPVPSKMVPVCMQALDEVMHGDMHELIDLPEGVLYRGCSNAPAWAICEQHHMYDFVAECEECGSQYIYAQDSTCNTCAD